jgi:hypothetical protein
VRRPSGCSDSCASASTSSPTPTAVREEWERDEWRIERLGIDTHDIRGPATLSFLFCDEPWLRGLIKRWVRSRLGCGLALPTIRWNLRGVRLFVEYCQHTGTASCFLCKRL